MAFAATTLVHTDEGDPIESTASLGDTGSMEPVGERTRSSAGEHPLHTGRVAGSIPAASTTPKRRQTIARGRSAADIAALREWGIEVDDALERTNPQDRSGHYTYLIHSFGSRVKIGHSNTPKKRLSQMQVGSPYELAIWKTWKLPRARAMLLERQLHAAFSWAYSRGEWFDIRPPAVEAVGDLLADERIADGRRLADLIQAIGLAEKREAWLKDAWYNTRASRQEKRAAEASAKLELPEVRREIARLWLEAFAMNYTGERNARKSDINRRIAHFREILGASPSD